MFVSLGFRLGSSGETCIGLPTLFNLFLGGLHLEKQPNKTARRLSFGRCRRLLEDGVLPLNPPREGNLLDSTLDGNIDSRVVSASQQKHTLLGSCRRSAGIPDQFKRGIGWLATRRPGQAKLRGANQMWPVKF